MSRTLRRRYEGSWVVNKKCGFGVATLSNGDTWATNWHNNKRYGHALVTVHAAYAACTHTTRRVYSLTRVCRAHVCPFFAVFPPCVKHMTVTARTVCVRALAGTDTSTARSTSASGETTVATARAGSPTQAAVCTRAASATIDVTATACSRRRRCVCGSVGTGLHSWRLCPPAFAAVAQSC
jgi:hypothetical protein